MKTVLAALTAFAVAACSSPSAKESPPPGVRVGTPPVEPQVTVRVIEKETGRPVPGARIRIPDTFDGDVRAYEDFMASFPNEDERWERIGHDVETDARGEVRLAANAVLLGLRASKDGLFGVCPQRRPHDRVRLGDSHPTESEASSKDADEDEPESQTDTAPEEMVIALEPDESMSVHCVDVRGRPAIGAMVGLRPKVVTKAPEDVGDYWWWARVRAADGVVTVEHLQELRKRFTTSEVQLVAGPMSGDHSPPASVRLAANEQIELVSAPGCAVIVNVQAPDGSTLPEHTQLTLIIRDLPKDPQIVDDDGTAEYENPVRDGLVEFRLLPLAMKFDIVARSPGWRPATATIPGATSSDAPVRWTITLGERLETLVGRLMLEDGTPYRDPFLHAWIDENGTRIALEDLTEQVDDAGHFQMDLNAAMSAVPDRTLTIEAEVGLASSDGHVGVGREFGEQEVVRSILDLSRALQPGNHVIGDIILKRVKH